MSAHTKRRAISLLNLQVERCFASKHPGKGGRSAKPNTTSAKRPESASGPHGSQPLPGQKPPVQPAQPAPGAAPASQPTPASQPPVAPARPADATSKSASNEASSRQAPIAPAKAAESGASTSGKSPSQPAVSGVPTEGKGGAGGPPKPPMSGLGAAGPGSTASNRWLLSQTLPIDVRLLAAGVVGSAGLAYYLSQPDEKLGYPSIPGKSATPIKSRGLGEGPPLGSRAHESSDAFPHTDAAPSKQEGEALGDRAHETVSDPQESLQEGETLQIQGTGSRQEAAESLRDAAGSHQQAAGGSGDENGSFHNEEIALAGPSDHQSETADGESEAQDGPGNVIAESLSDVDASVQTIDATPITDLLDDLGKNHWLPAGSVESSGEASAPADESLSASHVDESATQAEQAAALEAADKAAAEVDALETLAEVQELEAKKQSHMEKLKGSAAEAVQIVKESISDSAAETLIASHSNDMKSSKSLADENVPLGIDDDISAESLLQQAGAPDAIEGPVHEARQKQAEADAAVLLKLLQKQASVHQDDLADAHAVAEGHAQRAQRMQHVAQANAEQYKQAMAAQQALAESQREAELQMQAQFLTTAHAEATVRERASRGRALDQVRAQVNALSQAFRRRSDEQLISTSAHHLASGTFALAEALAKGKPYMAEVEALAEGCQDDHLVIVALTSVPQDYAETGLPTRAQLAARWQDVSRATRQLSYIPSGSGGMLSIALAGLAARLKLREANAQPASTVSTNALPTGALTETLPETVDIALARAHAHLIKGELQEAAHVLELSTRGTLAQGAVAEWAAAARARATAEQAVTALQAHASSISASLS